MTSFSNVAPELPAVGSAASELSAQVADSFTGPISKIELNPGDVAYRAYQSGATKAISNYVTDAATASRINTSAEAIKELNIPSAIPNRIATLQVTRPINVYYGLINGGGENAYQYYINTNDFDALKLLVRGGLNDEIRSK